MDAAHPQTRRLLLFGPTRIAEPGGGRRSPGEAAARRILSHLTVAQPEAVSDHALIEHGWAADEPGTPRSSLRMAVSRLRRKLTPDPSIPTIVRTSGGYRLAPGVESDVGEFELLVHAARRSSHHRNRIEKLTSALDLWRGVPYEDGDSTEFVVARQRLDDLRLEAVRALQEAALDLGEPALAGDHLVAALADHPLNDELVGLRMRTLYTEGDQEAALDLFERHRRRLADELGVHPGPDLVALEVRILRHELWAGPNRLRATGVGWVVGPVAAGARPVAVGSSPVGEQAIGRAEESARLGHWDDAAAWYEAAVDHALAADDAEQAALHGLRFAHVVWDPVVGSRVATTLEGLRDRIVSQVVRARVTLCLAGGLFRTGYEAACVDPEALRSAVAVLAEWGSDDDLGWGLTHLRDATTGELSSEEALRLTEEVAALDLDDPLLLGQTERAAFLLLMRLDRRPEAWAVLRAMRVRVAAEGHDLAANSFGMQNAENCWNLALGRWSRLRDGLGALLAYKGRLGASTVDELVMAQSFWLARELGDADNLAAHREGALGLATKDPAAPHWRAAAAVLAADLGQVEQAVQEIEELAVDFDLGGLPAGSHRAGVLAVTAEILGVGAAAGVPGDEALAAIVLKALQTDVPPVVMLGWPAVILGAKSRFVAFAALACGRRDLAVVASADAVQRDRWMPALRSRSLMVAASVHGEDDVAGRRLAAEANRVRCRLLSRIEGG